MTHFTQTVGVRRHLDSHIITHWMVNSLVVKPRLENIELKGCCVMLPSCSDMSDLLQFLLYLPLPGGRILGRNHPGRNSHRRTTAGELTRMNGPVQGIKRTKTTARSYCCGSEQLRGQAGLISGYSTDVSGFSFKVKQLFTEFDARSC